MKKVLLTAGVGVVALSVALGLYLNQRVNTGNTPAAVRIWGDHVVEWAFDQPHFANPGVKASATATLKGRVAFPTNESGGAIVMLSCAERKTNVTYSASTRYPHLPRLTHTDGNGNFKFEHLDSAWSYDVDVVAPGCEPKSLLFIDPSADAFTVNLRPVESNHPAGTVMRGQVRDSSGRRIPGALVRILWVTQNLYFGQPTTNGWIQMPGPKMDRFAVSDDAGRFVVYGKIPFSDVEGDVEADGFAAATFQQWNPDDTIHEMTLAKGASLTGRLLQAGKPVANAEIRVDQFAGKTSCETWNYSALTDNTGRFSFTHLPADHTSRFYGTMESLAGRGAVAARRVQVPGEGLTNDLGNLNLAPGFKMNGRIRLTDGRSIPLNSQVVLLCEDTADKSRIDEIPCPIAAGGSFHFDGVRAGPAALLLWVRGYRTSWKDLILKSGSARQLTVTTNLNDFVIKMSPVIKADVLRARLFYLLRRI